MKIRLRTAIAACAFLLLSTGSARGQDTPIEQLRVFIDCSYMCDMDFMRQNVNWVSYMQDRTDAHVHVLVSSQSTGGGGQRFTLEFIGTRDFAGEADTLTYTSTSEDTGDTRRRGLTRTIAVGLMPFVARTQIASRLDISLPQQTNTAAAPQPAAERDPWNFWNFRVSVSGNMDGESTREQYRISNTLSANRITDDWKLSFSVNGSYNETKVQYCIDNCTSPDLSTHRDTTVTSIIRNYGLNTLTVRSISPHVSIGARTNISTSTFGNTSLSLNIAPAIEYSFFPYSQATTRSLTALYSAGIRRFEYRDSTIYDQIEETRPSHNLSLGYGVQRTWGAVSSSISASQYLHDPSKYNVTVFAGVSEIRLFRGFSFNLFGQYVRVRDQITLAKGGRTADQVLLRQREIATNYRFFVSGGITYRFGSIFNNVVNPRFGGSGGGMMIMM